MPKWLFHPLTVLAATIIAIWLYISLLQTEEKMRLSAESVAVLDQEVEQIASEIANLENRLEIANSQQSQEQRIRDELLLKKPGEYVIQLPVEQPIPDSTSEDKQITPLEAWLELIN